MRHILLSFLCLAFLSQLEAQPLRGQTTTNQKLETAEAQLAKKDYYQALEWYEKYYKEERDLAVAKQIADLHFLLRDYNKATRWYKRVVERKSRKKPNPFLPEIRYVYGRTLKMNGNYPDAIEELTLYISESEDPVNIARAKREIEGARLAQSMQPDMEVSLVNAGKKVNTKSSEYSPLLASKDEMYFTAMREDKIKELGSRDNDYHSKLFLSKRGEDGWEEAMEAGGVNINREGYHTGNISFSRDGQRMYFTRATLEGNVLMESKLYYSDKGDEGWAPANEVPGINGDYIIRQPAAGELFGNEVIYFASNMDGGYGGYDLYYATRQGDGFTSPVNLGDIVNTDMDEESPYFVDGNLYFSSEGHPGLGGFDIFKSEWNGSVWSGPMNLGKPYNSMVDDLYYSIDKDGYNGTLVSNREGGKSLKGKTCCTDIWELTKEEVVLDLQALTFADGKPLNGASVQLVEMTNNTMGMTNDKTSEASHIFGFPLKSEMAYMVIGSKEGFVSDTLQFNTVGITSSNSFEQKLNLEFIPPPPPPKQEPEEPVYEEYTANEPIELGNIFYDFDDAKILTESESDLAYLAELMNKYPDMVIELSSHTDSQGLSNYNKKLSQRRATSAKDWLVQRGIVTERIQDVGYGETQIRNQCVNGVKCEDDEHRYNRRTEFKIIAGPTSIQIEKKRLKKN